MPTPLKYMYDETFLSNFAKKIHSVYDKFNIDSFIHTVMDNFWESLELKERIRKITLALGEHLPTEYEKALDILFSIDESCVGFPYLFFPDFVEVYGQADEHWSLSMKALERFTIKSSSEFAVRPFILKKPETMILQMKSWATSSNEHVRRLASEGLRPRLPWGMSLPIFKTDPIPVLSVLEILKSDKSLYVRKSVSNNLNDISKDNPNLVLETALAWKGVSANTDWIIRHGCRTLIKKSHPKALELFGYSLNGSNDFSIKKALLKINPYNITIGDSCDLHYDLKLEVNRKTKIRIEYKIDFIKAKGKKSSKAFLLSDKEISKDINIEGRRTHSFKDLTTRKHYPGEHSITLLINGNEVSKDTLILK
ncbi:3-methyladenine DNA glycosylase AlkC [Clostridium intestinale DSM 6191]|uniref:3-methyladenine DNA glycosylase AlkC n=2 Tax=Clostridium intestinale TaxID=36845 RepID=A0A1M5VT43_9CLOT|nr:3-methyladenine DNA glycosylase AlkC [Clostridium intestinale DSM 6191]